MKYIEVCGGLGNQMFQYAYYLLIKDKFKDARLFISSPEWEHSGGFELTRVFGINHIPSFWEKTYHTGRVCRKLFSLTHKRYQGRNFKVQTSDLNPDAKFKYFYGTWQSEQYFINPECIRKSFQFKEQLLNSQTKATAKCLGGVKVTVSIHIRRGDYLSQQFSAGFGNCCPLAYYRESIHYMKTHLDDITFVLFSDDMDWVKENLPLDNAIYVDHNHGADSWQDMYLMSMCQHNIIANSTFSWWGAWLNDNTDKIVIAPKRWWSSIENDDVVPESWIRL